MIKILAIETSCDETASAIVDEERNILAHNIYSQLEEHKNYGGVVPEIAARAHLSHIDNIVRKTLMDAQLELAEMDAIAATGGPGLIGGVIVGVMTAKAIASSLSKPFIAVNHLEGHALTVRLTDKIDFPYLLLLISGGHCQILIVEGVGRYKLLGKTLDDAIGEAFDKVAKMLGISYPGGAKLEKLALGGDPHRYNFPVALKGRVGCDFSCSGLKTAVRQVVMAEKEISEQFRADIAASFQRNIGEMIQDRLIHAIASFKEIYPEGKNLVIAGGVAANNYLRSIIAHLAELHNMTMVVPPPKLCTDNAAMIAWVAIEKYLLGDRDGLDFDPKPIWPLT